MVYMVMAYMVMAYIVIAYMAYIVVACMIVALVMAHREAASRIRATAEGGPVAMSASPHGSVIGVADGMSSGDADRRVGNRLDR